MSDAALSVCDQVVNALDSGLGGTAMTKDRYGEVGATRSQVRSRQKAIHSNARFEAKAEWSEEALRAFAEFLLMRAAQRRIMNMQEDEQRIAS